jgi:DDE superfamily endonuclease
MSGLQALMTIEGAVDAQVFELYVEHLFLPELFTDNTVVLDRVNFHFSQRAIDLIKAAEAEVLYLPAYSPFFDLGDGFQFPTFTAWHLNVSDE